MFSKFLCCIFICLFVGIRLTRSNPLPEENSNSKTQTESEEIDSQHSDINLDAETNQDRRQSPFCVGLGENGCQSSSECCGYPNIVCLINLNTWITTCVPRLFINKLKHHEQLKMMD